MQHSQGSAEIGSEQRTRRPRGPGPDRARSLAVVVLAAGLGTRMRSATAKVLHRIAGQPLISYVLEAARPLAPDRVVVIVGHQAEAVQAACARHGHGTDLRFVLQAEQRGTGHAVRCAVPELEGFRGDVLILYGDVPALRADTLAAFVTGHRRNGATLSLLTACFRDPTGYGRIIRGPSGRIERIVEERDASPDERKISEINTGIYCVDACLLVSAVDALAADNAQGEYYLTDIVSVAHARDQPLWSRDVDQVVEVTGINTRAELADMEARIRRSIVEKWMAAGVTFEDPGTAYVGADVSIGEDTTIGPNIQLRGATVIGRGCRMDGNAYLQDARLGDAVHVKFGVVITESEVGDHDEIGPFAHLRPGTSLAAHVRIGNFVETKKARLGPGTKANHLTYLGDVTIGENTNVGAGTITCNYDGFRKYQTVIGDRVQIGSDTQLVAPVEVGSDAYVGAGTTVTQSVPPGTLVVSRVAQRHVEGWVARRRAREANAATPGVSPPPSRTTTAAARARTKTRAAKTGAKSGAKARVRTSATTPRKRRARSATTKATPPARTPRKQSRTAPAAGAGSRGRRSKMTKRARPRR
jgi:bifunctional UDP-N-acetylglucosamine pyrophosphorylase/glucosamine-1-phosphate N-acetyltransferase